MKFVKIGWTEGLSAAMVISFQNGREKKRKSDSQLIREQVFLSEIFAPRQN